MEIARRHLQATELRELLENTPDAVTVKFVDSAGNETEVNNSTDLRRALEPRPTVEEPAHHEGTRNQRRVTKKLMNKANKANKRR